jgi:transcriptional regulator with XRE-family HTH domain
VNGRGETGVCLRALRVMRGWSQRQAAAAARVPLTRLSDYELGKSSPTVERLEAIVAALGYEMVAFEVARQLVRTGRECEVAARGKATRARGRRVQVLEVCGEMGEVRGTGVAVGFFLLPVAERCAERYAHPRTPYDHHE